MLVAITVGCLIAVCILIGGGSKGSKFEAPQRPSSPREYLEV